MPVEDTSRRLNSLISKYTSEIQASFISAVNASKSSILLKDLVDLLERGQFEEALKLTESIPLSVSTKINISFVEAGNSTAGIVASLSSTPTFFDQTNRRAVDIMRGNRGRLIREFTTGQREVITDVITDGITRGLNPIEQARNFRQSIGLTRYQSNAVNNFRNLLETSNGQALNRALRDRRFDPTVMRSIKSDTPLTRVQITKMVDRYRERFIKYRGEVIGRTEALRSVHEANNEMFSQAIDDGKLDGAELESTWHVISDTNLRDSHAHLSGVTQPFGEPFISGNGNFLRFPGDPTAPASDVIQCRCSLTTTFKRVVG